MKRIIIGFPENLLTRLSSFCAENEYAIAEVVREAVRKYLDLQQGGDGDIVDLDRVEIKKPVVTTANMIEVQSNPKELPTEKIWEDRNLEDVMAKVKTGFCDKHYWDKVSQKLFLIKFENANGDLTLENKWYCQKCVDDVKKGIEENGGKLLSTV